MSKEDVMSILKHHTKLIVSLASSSNEHYESIVLDINNDGLYIAVPTKKGVPASAVQGSVLSISALTENGRISFDSKVLNVIEKPVHMLVISIPEDYRNEQLRQFYRIPVRMHALMFKGNSETLKALEVKGEEVDLINISIEDISGGGCRVNTSEELKENDIVMLNFSGTPLENMPVVESKIVRVTKSEGRYLASLRFLSLDEASRDLIVRFVFRRQMELRHIK